MESESKLILAREKFEGQIEISKFSKMVPKLDAQKYRRQCLMVVQSAGD